MKSVLIVSELFPPLPGIGGRRWAKFAKYFTRLGINVHVLTATFNKKIHSVSLWYSDVKGNPNIHVHKIKLNYPEILNLKPKTVYQKVKYRLATKYLLAFTKGSIYDRTIFWNENYVQKAEQIILKNNIDTVIVTVAPLNIANQIILLKRKYPHIKFIVDFRDPWVLGNRYGFPLKQLSRQNFETEKERVVCEEFDLITMPNSEMMNNSSNFFRQPYVKYYRLEHAIDLDEFAYAKNEKDIERISVLFIGTLYDGLKTHFDSFFEVTNDIDNLHVNFFISNYIKSYFELAKPNRISLKEPIKPTELFNEISNANFVLIIYSDSMQASMYTKIIEIICARTPIIFISNPGEATEFVVSNNLGIHLNYDEVSSQLPKILKDGKMKNYNYNFDVSEFTFENVTNKLVEKIKSL